MKIEKDQNDQSADQHNTVDVESCNCFACLSFIDNPFIQHTCFSRIDDQTVSCVRYLCYDLYTITITIIDASVMNNDNKSLMTLLTFLFF